MTLIELATDCPNYYILTTEKGKTVEVMMHTYGGCHVYIKQNGGRRYSYGKAFGSIAQAAESYKRQDIKSALYALAEA
jgi:hypothetical protein